MLTLYALKHILKHTSIICVKMSYCVGVALSIFAMSKQVPTACIIYVKMSYCVGVASSIFAMSKQVPTNLSKQSAPRSLSVVHFSVG